MNKNDDLLKNYLEIINTELESYIIKNGDRYDNVKDAMLYSLQGGGKRLRAILVLEFCKISGGEIKSALPFACAIEMIHSYSLIHDDLPCMDNSDTRRGKPSCHIKYGEANALLAGDALLTMAFNTIYSASIRAKLDAKSCLDAIKSLSFYAGIDGMVGGQVMDLQNENSKDQVDVQILSQTHIKKTGALIKSACEMGVIAGHGTKNVFSDAAVFGDELGLAFQIIDDILDVEGNPQELGKPVGGDSDNNKTTFVTFFGLDSAKKMAADSTLRAMNILKKYDNSEFLQFLTHSMLNRNV